MFDLMEMPLCARGLEEFKLYWPAGLLLGYDSAGTDRNTAYKIADSDFDYIATTQFAADREIEHSPVAYAFFVSHPEPNSLNLLEFQCPLGANYPAGIPRTPILGARLIT